jgi:hypothetical protein
MINPKSLSIRVRGLCQRFNIAPFYLFRSQAQVGFDILREKQERLSDPESDIDIAALFSQPPKDPSETYATLSLELQDLASLYRADLFFFTKSPI